MEITQTRPLTIVILQDGTRLFAETTKEKITIDSQKNDFLQIQGNMISTVRWNIRTIRDATDAEYYEFFILEKLPIEVMEKMHIMLGKIYEEKTRPTLLALLNYQKTVQENKRVESWNLTPQEKENRRHNVIKLNEVLVKKWFLTQMDSDRIIKKILTNAL